MKAKIGRPRLEITRSVLIGARFNAQEAQQIEDAVARMKRGKSEWIRETLLTAAGVIPNHQEPPPAPAPPVIVHHPADDFLD